MRNTESWASTGEVNGNHRLRRLLSELPDEEIWRWRSDILPSELMQRNIHRLLAVIDALLQYFSKQQIGA
jgi:hypothetical protein